MSIARNTSKPARSRRSMQGQRLLLVPRQTSGKMCVLALTSKWQFCVPSHRSWPCYHGWISSTVASSSWIETVGTEGSSDPLSRTNGDVRAVPIRLLRTTAWSLCSVFALSNSVACIVMANYTVQMEQACLMYVMFLIHIIFGENWKRQASYVVAGCRCCCIGSDIFRASTIYIYSRWGRARLVLVIRQCLCSFSQGMFSVLRYNHST